MQIFGPRTSTQGSLYSAADVQAVLTKGVAQEQYVFDLLDQSGVRVADLTPFVEKGSNPPQITYDTTQAVKRTLRIRFRGDVPLYAGGDLSLNSQVRVHHQIRMPDGGYVDFVVGTFIVLPAGGQIWPARTWHDLQGADYGQLLLDYNFQSSASVPGGTPAVSAIQSLLSVPGGSTTLSLQIPDIGRILAQPISWDPGMSRLKAINDVLAAVGYFPAWFDEMGVLRSSPYPDWNTLTPAFTFDGTQKGSILMVPLSQTVDWSGAGNIQTVYVEDPRRPAFAQTYTNDNPLSAISTRKYHPKSLPPIKDSNIPDPPAAYAIARHFCQLAARLYLTWSASTFTWPLAQDQDVYGVRFSETDDGSQNLLFVEMGWTLNCKAGAKTTHSWQQLVAA